MLPPVELLVAWAAVVAGAMAAFIAVTVIVCQYCRGAWRADPG